MYLPPLFVITTTWHKFPVNPLKSGIYGLTAWPAVSVASYSIYHSYSLLASIWLTAVVAISTLFVATRLHKSVAHNSTTINELISKDAIVSPLSPKILRAFSHD